MLRRSNQARKTNTDTKNTFHYATRIFVLSSAALATACGSHSAINPSTPVPATSAALNIAASLPAATVGAGYSGTVSASGGTAPYSYSVASGQLPGGVTLAAGSGAISGTPSAGGTFDFAVTATDSKGLTNQKSLQIAVADNTTSSGSGTGSGGSGSGSGSGGGTSSGASTSSGNSFSNVQRAGGWSQDGQGPPNFVDCSPSPCNGIEFSMTQGINDPSMSGNATVFWIGGTTPYSDALFHNHLIGPFSSQGMVDGDYSLVPTLHDFTYDVYFYGDNLDTSEALEFDINQFFDGMGLIFGHQCRIANGNQWDVFDNQKGAWMPTGIPCYPKSGTWNHLTIKVHRTSDNHLTYQSITLNGQTSNLNWSLPHGSASNWYGVTINFQMDGNFQQDSYKVYLDNLTLSYE